jgi:predicted nucleic acid-binding protein
LTSFVLDCSVAISWCLPDETNDDAEAILHLLAENAEAVVPSIWWLEIVNVLIVAERRQRITETQTAEELAMLQSLPISLDTDTTQRSTTATLALGRQYNLAADDAGYLELAIREGLLLATIALRRALS